MKAILQTRAAHVEGGSSGGSIVRRPSSEDTIGVSNIFYICFYTNPKPLSELYLGLNVLGMTLYHGGKLLYS